jgi:hypothetical protein
MQGSAAREDFEILALPTQQDQRSGIAWPYYRFTGVSRRLHNIVHGKKSAKN